MASPALGELEALLVDRQEAYRRDFHGRFQVFASPASRVEYESLFGYNPANGEGS